MKKVKDIIIGLLFGYVMIMFVIPAYVKYQQTGSVIDSVTSQVQSTIIQVSNGATGEENPQSPTLFDGSGIDVYDKDSEGLYNEKRAHMTPKERHDSRVHSDGSACDHFGFSDN